uniref:Uncharacterized protein n=1 Tax=Haptolina ericina TaxID=156174 RepID=A0A7S3AWU6_9EUKA
MGALLVTPTFLRREAEGREAQGLPAQRDLAGTPRREIARAHASTASGVVTVEVRHRSPSAFVACCQMWCAHMHVCVRCHASVWMAFWGSTRQDAARSHVARRDAVTALRRYKKSTVSRHTNE